MPLLRLVLAWLLTAALPLQGMAAASMLLCDQAAHSAVAAHDHGGHPHGHGAAAHHGHDGHHGTAAAVQHAHAEPGAADGTQPHDVAKADDASPGHACLICASCCNLLALSATPVLNLDAARPAPPAPQGPVRVLTRHAPTPDKPPRA